MLKFKKIIIYNLKIILNFWKIIKIFIKNYIIKNNLFEILFLLKNNLNIINLN